MASPRKTYSSQEVAELYSKITELEDELGFQVSELAIANQQTRDARRKLQRATKARRAAEARNKVLNGTIKRLNKTKGGMDAHQTNTSRLIQEDCESFARHMILRLGGNSKHVSDNKAGSEQALDFEEDKDQHQYGREGDGRNEEEDEVMDENHDDDTAPETVPMTIEMRRSAPTIAPAIPRDLDEVVDRPYNPFGVVETPFNFESLAAWQKAEKDKANKSIPVDEAIRLMPSSPLAQPSPTTYRAAALAPPPEVSLKKS